MKKAGNLTHALSISSGDFIAVIDADFAVRPEFLYETMPYFSDPRSASSRPLSTTMSATVFLLHPALCGNSSGDILSLHPAGPGPL